MKTKYNLLVKIIQTVSFAVVLAVLIAVCTALTDSITRGNSGKPSEPVQVTDGGGGYAATAEETEYSEGDDSVIRSVPDAGINQDKPQVKVNNQDKPVIAPNQGVKINSGKENYDRVIDDYTRMIQNAPNSADIYHSRGFAYYNKGEYDRAIDDYTRAIQIDPKNAVTYNNRGAAYNNKGDYDRAIADLDQAIRLNPDFESPYRHRALAYMKKGNYRQARADINKALQINPGNQSIQILSAELQRLGY